MHIFSGLRRCLGRSEQKGYDFVDVIHDHEAALLNDPEIGAVLLSSAAIPSRLTCQPISEGGDGLAGPAAKPQHRAERQDVVEIDPDGATRRFIGKAGLNGHLPGLCPTLAGFQLNVTKDAVAFDGQIVAGKIRFRPQDLDLMDAAAPEASRQLPDKDMFDKLFAQGRVQIMAGRCWFRQNRVCAPLAFHVRAP